MDFKQLFLTFDGRLNRQPYWIGTLLLVFGNLVGSGIGHLVIGGAIGALIAIIVSIALLYPSICIAIKRCHDRDKSGWWILIMLVPLIGVIWYLVEFGFMRGTVGPNRYGPDPLEGQF